jgi:hypothetical protein
MQRLRFSQRICFIQGKRFRVDKIRKTIYYNVKSSNFNHLQKKIQINPKISKFQNLSLSSLTKTMPNEGQTDAKAAVFAIDILAILKSALVLGRAVGISLQKSFFH